MSGFDTEWLDLREPADHAARDPGLLAAFVKALPDAPKITDLGCGTGSTCRALAPLIPNAQWRLVDNDPALLAEAHHRVPTAETVQGDLASDLAPLFDATDAITASALIDLVSEDWLTRFAEAARGRVIYIALTYDGREQWHPAHPDDEFILTAFQTHQRRDKGLGSALGSEAVSVLSALLSARGWQVQTAPSPWRLKRGALMESLAQGICDAAIEAGAPSEQARRWFAARRQAVSCTIGHTDLLAIPSDPDRL